MFVKVSQNNTYSVCTVEFTLFSNQKLLQINVTSKINLFHDLTTLFLRFNKK